MRALRTPRETMKEQVILRGTICSECRSLLTRSLFFGPVERKDRDGAVRGGGLKCKDLMRSIDATAWGLVMVPATT